MTNYVLKRPSGYYFRYVIPKPYEHLLNQRELRYPLGTHQRRTATRRARAAVCAVERLLRAVDTGAVTLTQDQIRERVKAYAQDRQSQIDEDWLSRENEREDYDDAAQGILIDRAQLLDATIHYGTYSRPEFRELRKDLAKFLEVTEEQAVTDPHLAAARREWARAERELYAYQIGLYSGKPMAGDVEYLARAETPTAPPETPTATKRDTRTLQDWLGPFLEMKEQSTQPGEDARKRYETAVMNFDAVVGDVPVAEITGEHVTVLMRDLQRLPGKRNTLKRYRDMTVPELLEAEIPDDDLLTGTTINGHLEAIAAIMDWLRESHAVVTINPFKGAKVPAIAKKRPAYTDEDLERIFTSALWTPGSAYSVRYGTAAIWWLPILALFTGARQAELVQMPLKRVRTVDGVLCLDLEGADEEGVQVKTRAALRRIPVHPELTRLGLEDYAGALREAGAMRLLEAIPLGKSGTGAKASDWWTRYRNENFPEFAVPESTKWMAKDFHSFRTTHGTRSKTLGINELLKKQWFGHSDGQRDDVSEAHYNTGQPIAMLHEELSKLHWDVKALRDMPQGWRDLPFSKKLGADLARNKG